MASLKNLAGQTLWYGLSNIGARLLNYILTPLITYLLNSKAGMVSYGEYSTIYAAIPFANIIFTYGLETAYFRFSNKPEVARQSLYDTSFASILLSTAMLGGALFWLREPVARFLNIGAHPEYITWVILIIALDTLSTLPFAKLRQENRPKRYAFTKVAGILLNIVLVIFFMVVCPKLNAAHPDSPLAQWYRSHTASGFLILSNLGMAAFTFLLLIKEWSSFRLRISPQLWRAVLAYALPFVLIGLGGMVNETVDRIMLQKLYHGTEAAAKTEVGIYSSNYKLSIVITLFINAFRMAAEPFFFAQSGDKNAPKTYAKVMKWFVITVCFAFLTTALFLDVWKYMEGSDFRTGLGVVPVLLYANIALGVYYNLSVWYKITGQLRYGIGITLVGALLTLIINFVFIRWFGMWACAWATLICYATMMALSYYYGQKHFPVPYSTKKLLSYLGVITILFFAQQVFSHFVHLTTARLAWGILLLLIFLRLVFVVERKELKGFPVIGRYIR